MWDAQRYTRNQQNDVVDLSRDGVLGRFSRFFLSFPLMWETFLLTEFQEDHSTTNDTHGCQRHGFPWDYACYAYFKSTGHLWWALQGERTGSFFVWCFLRSGSCTFLAFTFGNCFSFKYAHLSSSLSSFHASALILPALPGKQTIFPLQLLGNMR